MVDFSESSILCHPLKLNQTEPNCTKLNQTEPRRALRGPAGSPRVDSRARSHPTHHLSNLAVTMVLLRVRDSATIPIFGRLGCQFSLVQSWFSLGSVLVQFGTVWFSSLRTENIGIHLFSEQEFDNFYGTNRKTVWDKIRRSRELSNAPLAVSGGHAYPLQLILKLFGQNTSN